MPLKRIIDVAAPVSNDRMCFPQRRSPRRCEMVGTPRRCSSRGDTAETAAPTLREFTLGLLRTLARRQVWRMDPKIWEGFARCAKRSAPRSFPLLCELPPSALGEMLGKCPAMRQPLLEYERAPAVQSGISRAIMAVLQEDKQQQG